MAQSNASQPTGEALQLFHSISDQSNFYGQLALEETGKLVTIPLPGLPIAPQTRSLPSPPIRTSSARSSSSACGCASKARANGTGACAA
jgi:hypothetical protein